MMSEKISPAAISLAALSIEYCKVLAAATQTEPRDFVGEVLRYLPRFYITINDLDVEPSDTGLIYDTVTEEQYEQVRADVAAVLGQNEMYLDTPADDMQFSDTAVAVSLAEKLADIYQCMADFAATIGLVTPDLIPEVLDELASRFDSYLSDTICSALRAANNIFRHANFDE